MNHPTEEQFVLYYYGEGADVEEHIGGCEQCRASYQALQRVLNSVDSFPVPERAPDYEARVWAAVENETRVAKRSRWLLAGWRNPVFGSAAAAMLIVGAFLAGHSWRH